MEMNGDATSLEAEQVRLAAETSDDVRYMDEFHSLPDNFTLGMR